MKKVLFVYYSQTGQLTNIVKNFAEPLLDDPDTEVFFERIRPVEEYPFPWSFFKFFDIFPDCAHMIPPEIHPLETSVSNIFDLIILAYQTWFLAPSLPMIGFLKSESGREILKGKPVITIIGSRNMWMMGQEKMKKMIKEAGAHLLDNVVLTDDVNSFASFITTPRWMFSGKKDRFLQVFPVPGISGKEIKETSRFGEAIVHALRRNQEQEGKPLLQGLGACTVDEKLIFSENLGTKIFYSSGKLINKLGKRGSAVRKPCILFFSVFLAVTIIALTPLSYLLHFLLNPFLKKNLLHKKNYFEGPSGSETFKISEKINERSIHH